MLKTMILLSIPVLMLVGSADVANAALPASAYKRARDTAAYHLQVKVLKLKTPKRWPGGCLVQAKVVRVFRNKPGDLKVGQEIQFDVSCIKIGSAPRRVGPTQWQRYERLKKAKYLESYLNRHRKQFIVPRDQVQIISWPSKAPQFPSGPKRRR